MGSKSGECSWFIDGSIQTRTAKAARSASGLNVTAFSADSYSSTLHSQLRAEMNVVVVGGVFCLTRFTKPELCLLAPSWSSEHSLRYDTCVHRLAQWVINNLVMS